MLAGFAHPMFFVHHTHQESSEERSQSHINEWEGKMVAGIALHLARYEML